MSKINLELKISREELRKKLNIKDGERGPQGHEGVGIPGPIGPPGPEGSPDTPPELRDKLESLKKGEKLSIQAIEDLAEILVELRKARSEKGIGLKGSVNTSKSNKFRFADDETPSGTINGSNTDFTVSKTPSVGSLKVYRGGARQMLTADYTLSGKVITFLNAPQIGEIILVDYRY